MALNILFSCFQNILLALTITTFFQIDLKKKTPILVLLFILPVLVFKNVWIISVAQIMITVVFLIYEYQRQSIAYLLIPLGLIGLSIFLETFVEAFVYLLSNASLPLLNSIFSISLLSIFCLLFLRFTKFKKWKKYDIYIPFLITLIFIALTLTIAFLMQVLSLKILYFLLGEFVLLVLCSLHIFLLMNKQSKEHAEMTQRLAKEEVQKHMYNITQRSMNQISADKHMMIYTLMKINQMLSLKQDDEAKAFVKKELGKYTNYKSITSTGNPLFDYEISNKINQITGRNIEVKSLFSINERNPILAEENTVYYIEKCIDEILRLNNNIEEIQLFFDEINTYLKVKFIITYHQQTPENRNYSFEKYDLLMNYKINKDENYDEIIFLYHLK